MSETTDRSDAEACYLACMGEPTPADLELLAAVSKYWHSKHLQAQTSGYRCTTRPTEPTNGRGFVDWGEQ